MKIAMKIDLDRLREDATRAKSARLESGDARSKRGNGTFAAVRAALPVIDELIENGGCGWPDVVKALTDQGIRTRKGEPLTVPRLTSLIGSVRKQEAARLRRQAKRRAPADASTSEIDLDIKHEQEPRGLGVLGIGAEAGGRKLALSAELAEARRSSESVSQAASEERDRKDAHNRMGRFVKGQR